MSTTLRTWLVLLVLYGFLITSGKVYAQNVRMAIKTGTTLTVANNVLVLKNTDVQCDGGLDASNALLIVTGANSTSFGGSGIPVIQALDLNTASSATMTLSGGMQISGTLNFQQGVIDLNNHQIQLTNGALLQTESETSHLTGTSGGSVTASMAGVNAPLQVNIGNLGAMLTSGANLGNVTVTRSHKPATNPGNSSLHGIQRTYLIQPAQNSGLNATLRFYYLDEELNGDDANTLSLWKSADGVSWMQVGVDTRNAAGKYIEKAGLADFSYWTLTDIINPLPLTLVSFSAVCQGGNALIGWQTGEESQLSHFEIERSVDGTAWATIGEVAAANNPTGAVYQYKDEHPLDAAMYRLKMVDLSGIASYSPVFRGGCAEIAMPFAVYPNPAISEAVARLSVREAITGVIQIRNMAGQLLYSSNWTMQPGSNQYILPVAGLAAGPYVVKLLVPSNSNSQETILIKK